MQSLFRIVGFGGLFTILASSVFAADLACMDRNQVLPLNNQQILAWKLNPTVPNAYQRRGNITGVVLVAPDDDKNDKVEDRNGHNHFIIQIGPNPMTDVIEVVYNQEFGALPHIQRGMQVHACGDFIKSIAQTGPYPPSPAGGIIHWIHMSDDLKRHDHGYLVIDNVTYGMRPDQSGRPFPGQRQRQGQRHR